MSSPASPPDTPNTLEDDSKAGYTWAGTGVRYSKRMRVQEWR